MIKEYVPKGTLPEALFPLNNRGVHRVAAYWDQGTTPADYIRPWVMTKDVSAGPGFHPILTDAHHYVRQNIIDPPNAGGNVLRPAGSAPHAIALPVLRQAIEHSHVPTPESPIAPRPLSPLHLPVPTPFQHTLLAERTTATTPFNDNLPSFPPHPFADPFPGNRLAPIPDLEERSEDPTRPTSPPYHPEQVVRDRETAQAPAPPPQTPAPSRVPTPPVISRLASPIVVDTPTPQSPTIPRETDWRDGARESEAIWPAPPTPPLPPSSPPPPSTPTPPASRYCWECGRAGHLIAGCSITSVRARTDVTARNWVREYDNHRITAAKLRIRMEQVAEEYGYHKQARERMVDAALWAGYPVRSVPTIDEAHPREPPPVIGNRVKRRRLA